MISRFTRQILDLESETLLQLAKPYVWTVPFVILIGLAASLLDGLSISMLIPILGSLTGSVTAPRFLSFLQPIFEWSSEAGPIVQVLVPTTIMLAAVITRSTLQGIASSMVAWTESRIGAEMRTVLARRMLDLGYPFMLGQSPSRLVNIVSNDAWRATDAVRVLFSIFTAWASVIIFSILLLSLSSRLFALVCAGVLVIRGLQVLFARRMRVLGQRISETNERLSERMLHVVLQMRLILLFGQQRRELEHFSAASNQVSDAMYGVQRASALMGPSLEVMQATLFVFVLVTAHATGMALPTIAAFLVLLYRMQPQVTLIGQMRITLASLKTSIREVEWLLGSEGKPPLQTGTDNSCAADQTIHFQDVSFAYPDRSERGSAIEGISFKLYPGRITALIGASGSGKSTIVNLLCRLIDPTSGVIMVGAQDLKQIDPEFWRSKVGLAGQDIDLMEGSMEDNIRYGAADASFEDVREAAKIADADEFISSLPDGYATRSGMRGLNLSGGQRQRIGLARALLRKPEILILDEATNAVDGISETLIMQLLQRHGAFRTALVISHRRSTLAACEDGLVIADGRLVEAGPLHDLDFYRRMETTGLEEASER